MSSPSKSFRSRMGGVMRRTSSVLAISRPSTPAADESRRSSVSKSGEGRKSKESLLSGTAAAPQSGAVDSPPPEADLQEASQPPESPPVAAAPPEIVPPEEVPAGSNPAEAPSDSTQSSVPVSQTNGDSAHKAVKRLLPIAAQYYMHPSPISESPIREAEATAQEAAEKGAHGPSPLAASETAEAINVDGVQEAPPLPAVAEAPAPAASASPPQEPVAPPAEAAPAFPEPVAAAPEVAPATQNAYLPPPMLFDSSNPGAFTDEPEDMHMPAPEPVDDSPAPAAAAQQPADVPKSEAPAPAPSVTYFDLVPPTSAAQPILEASPASADETIVATDDWHRAAAVEPYPYNVGRESAPAPPEVVATTVPAVSFSEPSTPPRRAAEVDVPLPHQWNEYAGWESSVPAHEIGEIPSAVDNEDPFADPPRVVQEVPLRTEDDSVFVVPIAVVDYDAGAGAGAERVQDSEANRDGGISTIPMPNSFPDTSMGPFGSLRTMPSAENLSRTGQDLFDRPANPPTDERRPLLAPDHGRNYHSTGPMNASTDGPQTLQDMGWLAYALPDGAATYYVHPTLRVTTDANLRSPEVLARVARALGYTGETGGSAGRGRMELWLRETGKGKGANGHKGKAKAKGKGKWRGDLAELGLARWWVDHAKREVSAGDDIVGKEDHLDMEYRYWAFMESHPAHTVLPFAARREAMDILTWAWTDRLLPPQELPLPPPFSQTECQELLGLLRSFGDTPQTEAGIQSIVHTRIVSRILLRVVHWRQHHFRPHKPLPLEASRGYHLRTPSSGFLRTAGEVLVSCILLGVPYLFYKRPGHHRVDAEGAAAQRSILPVLVVGACTCLLAAILLSASITFLSLPGLDNIARVVALIVALFASCSMASSLVALFWYKGELAESARPAAALLNPAAVGGEGMMLISTRSVVMSLPLVFLIYAVLGFVAAVVLYSFFGVDGSAAHFEQYTRWAVLGALGGLAGVLMTSVVLLTR